MDPSTFQAAFSSIAAGLNITKGLLDEKAAVKTNQVALELQQVILELQSQLGAIQNNQMDLLRAKEAAEQKLGEFERWEEDRAKYQLKPTAGGQLVYMLRQEHTSSEPPHWICPNCYENREKRIMQPSGSSIVNECPKCNFEAFRQDPGAMDYGHISG